MSAETGDGAAGWASGQPHVQRHETGLRAEAEQRQAEGDCRPGWRQSRAAHGVEGELPAPSLHHAERQQDRDRAEVRDQQIEKAGAADLGDAVLRRDEKVRRQRHRLPRHHEGVCIVGQQHEAHAGEEHVVLQTQQTRRRTFTGAKIPCAEQRDARRGGAQQEQEHVAQCVATQMERQIRQPERQYLLLGGCGDAEQRNGGERQSHATRRAETARGAPAARSTGAPARVRRCMPRPRAAQQTRPVQKTTRLPPHAHRKRNPA